MKFTTDPTIKSEIRRIILECFEDKSSDYRKAILTHTELDSYKLHLKIDAKLIEFTDEFYALLIQQYKKESLLERVHLIKFLQVIKKYKWYKNEDDKQVIEDLIVKLKKVSSSTEATSTQTIIGSSKYKSKLDLIFKCLTNGTLVPILGTDVNLCGRPAFDAIWTPQSPYPPTARELAQYLARERCPISQLIKQENEEVRCSLRGLKPSEGSNIQHSINDPPILILPDNTQKLAVEIDLPYLSECVALLEGTYDAIYNQLQVLFQKSYTPTPLHEFLAELPTKFKNTDFLIVTTNYDDILEKTFEKKGAFYDLLSYIAIGKNSGRFRYLSSEDRQKNHPGEVIKDYQDKLRAPRQQTMILKIHGLLDWTNERKKYDLTRNSGFIITEDHYINYLTYSENRSIIPIDIDSTLKNSNLLFLGYDLSDWRMRAILRCIWKEEHQLNHTRYRQSWVLPVSSGKLNRQLWEERNADILEDITLNEFIDELNQRLEAIPNQAR